MTTQTKCKVHIAICEYDPPFKDGRINRVKYLGDFLSKNNCQVTIYSFGPQTKEFSSQNTNLIQIKYPGLSLVENSKSTDSTIKKTTVNLIKKASRLIFPDRYILGIHKLANEIKKRSNENDILIVSAPQFSILLLLLSGIKRKASYIDYRDLWSGNPIFTNRLTKHLAKIIEQVSAKKCTEIIVTTDEASTQVRHLNKKTLTIYNGIPSEDLDLAEGIHKKTSHRQIKTITYFGSLGNKRNCKSLIHACNNDPNLNLKLYGNIDHEHKSINPSYYHGFADKRKMYEEAINSDFILIVILKEEHAEFAIPGKIYEAMITKNPILIYCPPNSLALKYLIEKNHPHHHINSETSNSQEEIGKHLALLHSKKFPHATSHSVHIREKEYAKLLSSIECHTQELKKSKQPTTTH